MEKDHNKKLAVTQKKLLEMLFSNFLFVYGGIMQRLPSATGLYIQWWRKLFDWFV